MSQRQIRRLKRAVIVLGAALVVAQAVRPSRTNPPVNQVETLEATRHLPADVAASLNRGCKDCHTNETTWPWYTNVAPASWLVIGHVNEGREHLNFSQWATLTPERMNEKLDHICKEVESRGMPLSSYLLIHKASELTDGERAAICAWTKEEQRLLGPLPPLPVRGR